MATIIEQPAIRNISYFCFLALLWVSSSRAFDSSERNGSSAAGNGTRRIFNGMYRVSDNPSRSETSSLPTVSPSQGSDSVPSYNSTLRPSADDREDLRPSADNSTNRPLTSQKAFPGLNDTRQLGSDDVDILDELVSFDPTPTSTQTDASPDSTFASAFISYPPYIPLTSGPSHSCDFFGPLCQTGSAVVGLNRTSHIATTTVACSEYLSAQAQSIRTDSAVSQTWQQSFGRSPQCTAFAHAIHSRPLKDNSSSYLLGCPASKATALPSSFVPPGVSMPRKGKSSAQCCGSCVIDIDEVRVLYFKGDNEPPCSQSISSAASSITDAPKIIDSSLRALVSDGYTFISPSLYVQIVGTASVRDLCGQLGEVITSSIIAVPPGGLSTKSFDIPVGSQLSWHADGSPVPHTIEALDTRDLACPTWGVNGPLPTATDDVVLVGPPYYPLVVPPPELLSIDPAWRKCIGNHWPLRYALFDPPRALTANRALAGPTAPTDPELTPEITAQPAYVPQQQPQPAQAPTPGEPAPTTPPTVPKQNPIDSNSEDQATAPNEDASLDSGESNGGGDASWHAADPAQESDLDHPDLPNADVLSSPQSDNLAIRPSPDGSNRDHDYAGGSGSSSQTPDDGPSYPDSNGPLPSNPIVGDVNSNPSDQPNWAAHVLQPQSPHGSTNPGAGSGAVPVLTIGPTAYTMDASSHYDIAPGQTLTPGGSAILSNGITVTLASNGAYAVIGSSTQILSASETPGTSILPTDIQIANLKSQSSSNHPLQVGTFSLAGHSYAIFLSTNVDGEREVQLQKDGQTLAVLQCGTTITLPDGSFFKVDTAGLVMMNGSPVGDLGGNIYDDDELQNTATPIAAAGTVTASDDNATSSGGAKGAVTATTMGTGAIGNQAKHTSGANSLKGTLGPTRWLASIGVILYCKVKQIII